jgi:hypothetical protein
VESFIIGEKMVEKSHSSKAGFSTMFLSNVENHCSCAVESEVDSACAIDLYEKVALLRFPRAVKVAFKRQYFLLEVVLWFPPTTQSHSPLCIAIYSSWSEDSCLT